MSDTLFYMHSGLRYVVLATWLVAVIVELTRLGKTERTRVQGALGGAFIGVLDLQGVLGIVVLITRGFYPALMGHVITMLLAIFTAHGFSLMQRSRPPEKRRSGFMLIGYVIVLVLIIGGIMSIGRPIL